MKPSAIARIAMLCDRHSADLVVRRLPPISQVARGAG